MACQHLLMALFGVVTLASLASVDGKYRISWITSDETNSGTNYWVGFELFKADGTKTEWMWPNEYFRRGRYESAEMDEPSIGDIAKVNVHVQKKKGSLHQDDWNGYQVVISDFETKKTYQFYPGHVDTEAYKKLDAKEVQCKDNGNSKYCRRSGAHCATVGHAEGAFNMAKHDFGRCLKTCNLCYPADSDEPEDEEAREDVEPSDDDSSADHEKKSTSPQKKNKENN